VYVRAVVPSEAIPPHRVDIVTPETQIAGVPADLVGVWHTAESFVLDFSAFADPARVQVEDGVDVIVQRARVVSRVRIPPSQVFEIMKALEQQLSAWERETGRAPRSQ
jgi:Protein of unknown function (DUF3467)